MPPFLSTLSLRRATAIGRRGRAARDISIHALLAESDLLLFLPCTIRMYFYPRSPCGERPLQFEPIAHLWLISIHALLAESDWNSRQATVHTWKFLSTLSLRRATPLLMFWLFRHCRFLSTLSLRRATANQTNLPG